LELQLDSAEKTATEWQKKYNELLNENREVKHKVTLTLAFDEILFS